MQDIGGAPAPANPAAVYSELGGVAGSADDLPNVSGTVAVDDNDDVSYVLSLCLHVLFHSVRFAIDDIATFLFIINLNFLRM